MSFNWGSTPNTESVDLLCKTQIHTYLKILQNEMPSQHFLFVRHLGILIKNSNVLLYYTYIQLFRTRLYSRTSVFSLIWFVDIIVLKSKDVLSLSQRLPVMF